MSSLNPIPWPGQNELHKTTHEIITSSCQLYCHLKIVLSKTEIHNPGLNGSHGKMQSSFTVETELHLFSGAFTFGGVGYWLSQGFNLNMFHV